MPVIKSSTSPLLARDAVVLDLSDVARQGEAIIAAAKKRAAEIVAEAQSTRARLIGDAAAVGKAEGLAEGLAEGHRAGAEQGRATALVEQRAALLALVEGWSAALRSFASARQGLLDEAGRDVLTLAMTIARKVTRRILATDPAVPAEQLRSVLELVMRPTRLVVRAHPEDVSLMRQALPELVTQFDAAGHVELSEDPAAPRGTCSARLADERSGGAAAAGGAPGGEIDASVEVQLDRIAEMLVPARTTAAPRRPGEEPPGGGVA